MLLLIWDKVDVFVVMVMIISVWVKFVIFCFVRSGVVMFVVVIIVIVVLFWVIWMIIVSI